MKRKYLAILIVVGVMIPVLVLAQGTSTAPCRSAPGTNSVVSIPRCINQIYTISLGAAALLALLMIIGGGYYKMTAAGNAEQNTAGTEMITAAIVGLFLLLASYLILRTINPDLVNFNLGACYRNNASVPAADPGQCQTQGGQWEIFPR